MLLILIHLIDKETGEQRELVTGPRSLSWEGIELGFDYNKHSDSKICPTHCIMLPLSGEVILAISHVGCKICKV